MVIKLEGENAVISMKGDASCRKCGAAALGLCKGGLMQVLTVRNSKQARVGDSVKIKLVQEVQLTGYLLAFVIPPTALVFGAVGDHFLGTYAGFPPLDIIAGFFSLIVVSCFSLIETVKAPRCFQFDRDRGCACRSLESSVPGRR